MSETQIIVNKLKDILDKAESSCNDAELVGDISTARSMYQLGYIRTGVKGVIEKYGGDTE